MAKSEISREDIQISAIEYASSIYGIYWGVWLSLYIIELLQGSIREKYSHLYTLLDPFGYIGFYLLVSLFTYTLVRIMIQFRYVTPEKKIKYFKKIFKNSKASYFIIATIVVIFFLNWLFELEYKWAYMGIWASVGWVLLLIAIIFSDWKIKS